MRVKCFAQEGSDQTFLSGIQHSLTAPVTAHLLTETLLCLSFVISKDLLRVQCFSSGI